MSAFNCVHKVDVLSNVCPQCEALNEQYPDAQVEYDATEQEDGSFKYTPHQPTECIHAVALSDDTPCVACTELNQLAEDMQLSDDQMEIILTSGEFNTPGGSPRFTTKGKVPINKPTIQMSAEEEASLNRRMADYVANRGKR